MSYCEWPEFYNESKPKAKKRHVCIECRAPIEIGEEHLYYRGKWDGEFDDGRQHLLCTRLCVSLRSQYDSGECVPFGSLFEEWSELGMSRHTEGEKPWTDKEKEQRQMMAQIKWRSRKERTLRKLSNGIRFKRKWGQPWEKNI